ncbi:CBS domain-containing protein [Neiella marina]|uniref:CBS domain-containing protein n=1 Tax=Neiella holothuriorum TaxID=2870530 RepID=A0ABS7EFM9_9GAMM|nr:DUF294 nucleotidyltransferase-like domain-containing protein [Neiella holothuriorum]MBW8190492.1 CBS domain-containing protein [Neiella holothuriorum]
MDDAQLPDVLTFLSQTAPFSELPETALIDLCNHLHIRYLARQQPSDLLQQSQLHWLRSGTIQLKNQSEIIDHIDTGGCFGASLPGHQQGSHLEVLQDALVYSFDQQAITELANDHTLVSDFLQQSGKRYLALAKPKATPSLQASIKALIKRELVAIKPDTTIAQAAKRMTLERVSALAVMRDGRLFGMLTDRDLRSRVLAEERSPDTRVDDVMTHPVHTIEHTASAIDALLTMSAQQIHHLPVTEDNQIVGLISSTDLLALAHANPLYLVGEIARQNSPKEIEQCCQQLPDLIETMLRQGMRSDRISQLISLVADIACRRLLVLTEATLGPPPQAYAWLCFGSQARQDMSASSDQDNGLLLAEPPLPEHQDYFQQLAEQVCQSLDLCGFVTCPGDIMASNPAYRLSRLEWLSKFKHWQQSGDPKALLNASIFFDFRAVIDPHGLAEQLHAELRQLCQKDQIFLALLARNAVAQKPPIGLFGRLILERDGKGTKGIELKKRALAPLVEISRVYGLAAGTEQADVASRLQAAQQAGSLSTTDSNNLIECWQFLLGLRLSLNQQQQTLLKPQQLTDLQRHQLKECFALIEQAQQAVLLKFAGGRS